MRRVLLIFILLFISPLSWSQESTQPASTAMPTASTSNTASFHNAVSQTVKDDDLDSLEQEGLKYSYLELPIYDADTVLEWAKHIGLMAFNFNYKTYLDRFSNLSLYFTYNGWKRFLTFLWLSSDYSLEHMIASQLGVAAELRAEPAIWASMPEDGRFTWEVLLPLRAVYFGPGTRYERKVNFVLRVSRVTTKIQKNGIAVVSVREVQPGVYPGTLE